MNGTSVRRRVRVEGRVQGVFFRDTCRLEAERLGVVGWVRNRPDGAVEAVFEGEGDAVRAMIEWARTGPPSAVVERVSVVEEEAAGEPAFRVK